MRKLILSRLNPRRIGKLKPKRACEIKRKSAVWLMSSSRSLWWDVSQHSLQVGHLKTILESGKTRGREAYNEVYPGIVLGDDTTAMNSNTLQELRVTHVLNAAASGTRHCSDINQHWSNGVVKTLQTRLLLSMYGSTSSISDHTILRTEEERVAFYKQLGIKYIGIPAVDSVSYDLSRYFSEAAEFIDEAVIKGGRILVHCQMGVSRSATLVIAYLMIKQGAAVEEAVKIVRAKRFIFPNDGFLQQLCQLNQDNFLSERSASC